MNTAGKEERKPLPLYEEIKHISLYYRNRIFIEYMNIEYIFIIEYIIKH